MLAKTRIALLVGVVGGVGCTISGNVARDGAPPPDVADGGPGLVVPFTTKFPVPGPIGDGIVVSSALFRVAQLRVIGDAGPGDTRTSRDHLELEWKAGASPAALEFSDAPSGLYSKISVQADGETVADSYDISGTVVLNGTSYNFIVHDPEPLEISIGTAVALDPGQRVAIAIGLELDTAFGGLDFSKLASNGGQLELTADDHQMPRFRAKLKASFVAIAAN